MIVKKKKIISPIGLISLNFPKSGSGSGRYCANTSTVISHRKLLTDSISKIYAMCFCLFVVYLFVLIKPLNHARLLFSSGFCFLLLYRY